ncbi:hypothetical protein ACFUT3_33980 [Streptomyces cinereoruber]|uniref:hypothetical protein n=1 Tax=Streptomyces cinereoruber TaxID=67260 RepID=UPI0036304120
MDTEIKRVRIPRTTANINQAKNLSKHATAVWQAWEKGFPISDEIWEDYLSASRVRWFPLEDALEELRVNGWIAA